MAVRIVQLVCPACDHEVLVVADQPQAGAAQQPWWAVLAEALAYGVLAGVASTAVALLLVALLFQASGQ